jgi:hypothetical protein
MKPLSVHKWFGCTESCTGSAFQFVLEHLVERIEEADKKRGSEGVILDEVEPIETGRRMHDSLLNPADEHTCSSKDFQKGVKNSMPEKYSKASKKMMPTKLAYTIFAGISLIIKEFVFFSCYSFKITALQQPYNTPAGYVDS